MLSRFFEVVGEATKDWQVYFEKDLAWVKFVMESFESLGAALYGQTALGGVSLEEDQPNEKAQLFERVAELIELVGENSAEFEETWGMPVVGLLEWKGCSSEGVKSRVKEEWSDLL